MLLADRFRSHADASAREQSPLYAEWSRGIAGDPDVLALIERAPEARRQPALVLAMSRWLGAPLAPWPRLREWMLAHPDVLLSELARRTTQVNDVRRPGRSRSRWRGSRARWPCSRSAPRRGSACSPTGTRSGPTSTARASTSRRAGARPRATSSSSSMSTSETPPRRTTPGPAGRCCPRSSGGPVSTSTPSTSPTRGRLVARDVAAARALGRVDLLRRAVAIARSAPPRLVRGDAVDGLAALASTAPSEARLVVVSTGTLVYLPGRRRQAFVDAVRALGATWVSYERRDLLHDVVAEVPEGVAPGDGFAALALDGRALAVGDAHGTRLRLLPDRGGRQSGA